MRIVEPSDRAASTWRGFGSDVRRSSRTIGGFVRLLARSSREEQKSATTDPRSRIVADPPVGTRAVLAYIRGRPWPAGGAADREVRGRQHGPRRLQLRGGGEAIPAVRRPRLAGPGGRRRGTRLDVVRFRHRNGAGRPGSASAA